jgi:FlaA1/EpsC-like NDP-sugar epimerase
VCVPITYKKEAAQLFGQPLFLFYFVEITKNRLIFAWKNACPPKMTNPILIGSDNLNRKVKKIKEIDVENLLCDSITHVTDIVQFCEIFKDKTILVTGAAGSIGGELLRMLSRLNPGKLILCDMAESPLYQLSLNLQANFPETKFVTIISDIRNYERMKAIFETYRPDYVYHAAAYKHVPMMEKFPSEAVLANVLGTKNVADLALKYETSRFVLVSTDKAVNPGNVMGASKRIAELYIMSLMKRAKNKNKQNPATRFTYTRFGNVLFSNGSVIPRFIKQIESGGPVTVTHPEVERFFMTISEACSLVLKASCSGEGGEVFVLSAMAPVRIKDLAEKLISVSGLTPYKDIDIVFTGLRPGEKLSEELLYKAENRCHIPDVKLIKKLIKTAHTGNEMEVVKIMKEIVPEFISHNSVYEALDNT